MGVIKKIGNNNMLNVVMLLVAIAVVSFFFPSEGKFSYEYEQGKPWGYSLLTAPFAMPVNMDSVTAMNTKDCIDSRFAPIYMRDSKTEKLNVNRIYESLENNADVTQRMKYAIIEKVRYVYKKGIVTIKPGTDLQHEESQE